MSELGVYTSSRTSTSVRSINFSLFQQKLRVIFPYTVHDVVVDDVLWHLRHHRQLYTSSNVYFYLSIYNETYDIPEAVPPTNCALELPRSVSAPNSRSSSIIWSDPQTPAGVTWHSSVGVGLYRRIWWQNSPIGRLCPLLW